MRGYIVSTTVSGRTLEENANQMDRELSLLVRKKEQISSSQATKVPCLYLGLCEEEESLLGSLLPCSLELCKLERHMEMCFLSSWESRELWGCVMSPELN